MSSLEDIFGGTKKVKNVKITKTQLLQHKAKHSASEEVKQSIIEAQEIRKYGKQARVKRNKKADMRDILINKGTRPKGAFYDMSTKANPLEGCFKIDGATEEGYSEARILHFGGKLD